MFCKVSYSCGCTVADPGENLTGAQHSRCGRGRCGGRGGGWLGWKLDICEEIVKEIHRMII